MNINLLILIVVELVILICYKHLLWRVHACGQQINGMVLPDIIHDYIPSHPLFCKIGDGSMIICIAVFFIVIMMTGRLDYLGYAFVYLLIAHIIYTAYTAATTLPDSKGGACSYNVTVVDIFKDLGSCNMLGISGHLLIIGITLFLLSLMQGHVYWPLYVIVYAALFLCIAASCNHYTVDCVSSTVVCALLFSNHKWLMRTFL